MSLYILLTSNNFLRAIRAAIVNYVTTNGWLVMFVFSNVHRDVIYERPSQEQSWTIFGMQPSMTSDVHFKYVTSPTNAPVPRFIQPYSLFALQRPHYFWIIL